MGTIKFLKHKWLRNIGFGLSLTTIAFIFQACYGPPRDYKRDQRIHGTIVDANGNPIEGIKISNDSTFQYARSNAEGYFEMYIPILNEYRLSVEDDRDSSIENPFRTKDTVLVGSQYDPILIKLEQKR